MKIPDNTKLYEGELATFWFGEHGILYAIGKPVDRTLENQKRNYALIRQISGNKKVCMLANATSSRLHDDETRKYVEKEMSNLFKAMAVISENALGKASTAIFKNLNTQPIPIEMFENEEDAKNWLIQYL